MKKPTFIGRTKELALLEHYARNDQAALIVIHGRRRIGKSRLIDEFARKQNYLHFTGLAPGAKITAQTQRDEFARMLGHYFSLPGIHLNDWADLFTLLARQCKKKRVVIFFDEISWMAHKDPTFLPKLKNAWDRDFKNNPNLMLILCGSVSTWIEKNILSSTGFVGRVHQVIALKELPLTDAVQFINHETLSFYERLKFIAITGGIPLYLELYDPTRTSEENIKQHCFSDGGLLVREFNNIFSDLFSNDYYIYQVIVMSLISGPKDMAKISKVIEKNQTGWLSSILNNLEISGFITRDFTWNLNTGRDGKLSRYRLSDNYIIFYLKYIEPNMKKISRNEFAMHSITSLPGWPTILGLQVENLILNNRSLIFDHLGIYPDEIINHGPFFQNRTTKQAGCQIDYLIQTKFSNLHVGEIKFSQAPIGLSVIKKVETKIKNIKTPKGFSFRPFLIHVNGVSAEVKNANYFAKIISLAELAT